jgi:hypothetical protein
MNHPEKIQPRAELFTFGNEMGDKGKKMESSNSVNIN